MEREEEEGMRDGIGEKEEGYCRKRKDKNETLRIK
jgi:hypothetical protein